VARGTSYIVQSGGVDNPPTESEAELAELFPKQSGLRLQAVRLLMHLEESGPRKQSELAEELGMEPYAMSRLLAKMELHRHIVRRRERTDKLAGLKSDRPRSRSNSKKESLMR